MCPNQKKRLKMRKLVTVFAGFLLMGASVQAQQISGVVKDQQGKGLEKSTISLLKANDSSLVKLVVTDDKGSYSVNASQTGNYLVSASHIGYATVYSKVFELNGSGITITDLTILKVNDNLREVIVTAKKPMIELASAGRRQKQE